MDDYTEFKNFTISEEEGFPLMLVAEPLHFSLFSHTHKPSLQNLCIYQTYNFSQEGHQKFFFGFGSSLLQNPTVTAQQVNQSNIQWSTFYK